MQPVTFFMNDDEPRPGFILKEWGPDCANLVVFVDGSNDDEYSGACGFATGIDPARWITSAPRYTGTGPKAGTWMHADKDDAAELDHAD